MHSIAKITLKIYVHCYLNNTYVRVGAQNSCFVYLNSSQMAS